MALAPALVFGLVNWFSPMSARVDIGDILTRCNGAQAVYTSSTAAAIIANYYTDTPGGVFLWPQANDMNQTLPDAAKVAMQLHPANIADLRGLVCFVRVITPLTTEDEERHADGILRSIPQRQRWQVEINSLATFEINLLERPAW